MSLPHTPLLARARALTRASRAGAGLAVTTLASASSVEALASSLTHAAGASVTYNNGGTATESGGPLAPIAGDGTTSVDLAGSAGLLDPLSSGTLETPEIVFENFFGIDADAGEFVRVDYDFDQLFESSSGGTYDITFDLTVEVDLNTPIIGSAGATTQVSVNANVLSSLNRSGTFDLAPLPSNISGEDLIVTLTASYPTGIQPPWDAVSVDVPNTTLTVSIVPEPATMWLLGLATLAAGLYRRLARS